MFNSRDSAQFIFPSAVFDCYGAVSSVIVGGSKSRGDYDPELQVWTPTGNGVYRKSSGATLSSPVMLRMGVYEYRVDCQLEFQPGDVLGLFQPYDHPQSVSSVRIGFDKQVGVQAYYIIERRVSSPHHTLISTANTALQTSYLVPLISVAIGKHFPRK